jgi:threonyl-tRNA synthetase
LCLGPHLKSTGVAKTFKIYKNSSSYWLGKDTNDSLQRVYGISFTSETEKEEWEKLQLALVERGHKNIGNLQELFMW